MNAEHNKDKDLIKQLGFEMAVPARIGEVTPGSPAALAGIEVGDVVTAISGEPVKDWQQMVEKVTANPGKDLTITVIRHHKLIDRDLTAGEKVDGLGFIGVKLDNTLIHNSKLNLKEGLIYASSETWNYSLLTLKMMYYVVTGKASLDNISGPVTIAQVAGISIQTGFTYFLDFLAIVSISLGVINLLPIPILDGGHLLYYIIEGIRGKPVSEAVQDLGFRIGLLILISLMFLAFYNDIVRLTVS
jgi:regulator of sigma E protease